VVSANQWSVGFTDISTFPLAQREYELEELATVPAPPSGRSLWSYILQWKSLLSTLAGKAMHSHTQVLLSFRPYTVVNLRAELVEVYYEILGRDV